MRKTTYSAHAALQIVPRCAPPLVAGPDAGVDGSEADVGGAAAGALKVHATKTPPDAFSKLLTLTAAAGLNADSTVETAGRAAPKPTAGRSYDVRNR
jgi:hypothetical protein